MKVISKQKWYVAGVLIITFAQLLFDTLNVSGLGGEGTTMIGAIAMFGSIFFSGVKQYFDEEIGNGSLLIQVLLFIAFVTGGVLDNLDMLPFNDESKSIVRLSLTMLTNYIPLAIKQINAIE